MVKVVFYNLLRSKYNVKETDVLSGTVTEIIEQILNKYPEMNKSDFDTAVVFYNGKPLHKSNFFTEIEDNSRVIITHFVGGG